LLEADATSDAISEPTDAIIRVATACICGSRRLGGGHRGAAAVRER
jgi:hypothetical protein